MNFLAESIHFSLVGEALGMTILHSLWQGVALMFLLALFLRLGKSVSSSKRFAVAFASLLIFLLAFAITFYQQWEGRTSVSVITLPAELPMEDIVIAPTEVESIPTEQNIEVETSQWEVWRTQLSRLAPWLAWLWIAGSIVFGLRLINGLVQSQRLRYRTQPIPADWQQRAEKLIRQLGISQSVSLASSDRSSTPLTLGWLKPIVLIPTSLLVMMPADQLEAILIHELAHIKRRDYLWNLIQSVVEVVLFYHPAYWYIASVLERERELACDALTVTVTRQPRIYAQALLQVAAHSAQVPLPSVAASGKRGLSDRIQRIIYPGKVQRGISVLPFVLLLSLISLSLAAFSWYQPNLNRQDDSLTNNALYEPVFTTQDGYGTMDSLFLKPLSQPDAGPIDYGPTFQEVMNGLSDEFLDTTNLTVDEMYQQAVTIDQALNQLSRSAARFRGDSLAESPVNYSAPLVVYLLDNEIVDPKLVKRFSVKGLEVFRAPFPPDSQNLVDREYSVIVRATSRKSKLNNAQGNLGRPDYIGHGYFASQTMPLFRHLYFISNDGYLVGQNDFSQRDIDPNKFFRNSTLYLLDGEVVDDPNNIRLNAVRRFEVYYAPLPTSLQKLADKEYSAVVRAFSREYQQTDLRPFSTGGQITTRQDGQYQPVSGIKVEVKETGQQALTNDVGKFQLSAAPEETLIFHLPEQTPMELAIDGREFFHIVTHIPSPPTKRYQHLQERLIQRMSKNALEKDREAIQQKINTLDKAINSLQRSDTINTLIKTITGRVMDAFANQGIEGVMIRATDGTTAVTDEKGYYKIFLPIHTTDTEFEFTHPDYPAQQMEVDAGQQKAVYLSLLKEQDRLIIHGERFKEEETIRGRIIEERSREGIAGVKIRATNGSTAKTDSEGYYQIQLPANTRKTIFEFTHPDYPGGRIEAKITGEKLNDILFIEPEHYQEKRDSIAQISEAHPVKFSQLQQLDSTLHPPLYIIDGVFVDDPLENLDPRSIMNIDVVKSPEAERRYGKKAIGGAVLITTKNPLPSRTIEGKVTSAEGGEPLPGVTIIVEGTNIGAVTDRDGEYSIQVPKGASNLVFSSASSDQKTVSVRGKRIVNVDLTFLSLDDPEHTLFVVNGQVREDINTLDGLDVNYYEIRQEIPRLSLPKKYRDQGYTKVVRVVTNDFQAYLGDRTVLGKLVDTDSGSPLAGVEVRWAKDGKKTVLARTDEQGKYQVTLPEEAKIIEYFRPGYTPLVITDRFVIESFPMRLTLSLEKNQLDKAAFKNKLKVYPNPGSQKAIRVKFTLESAAYINFYFYSKEGRLVHEFKPLYLLAGDQNVDLPTTQFPSDEYLLVMKINDGATFTHRVILE
jgi:beta-lactamase regulating signal transducer with metallopeptidase domain